ncbi:MAG: DUF1343 domain-containing protein [Caldilineaceae bacterium]|nr:DUF1343 domain-containing protein [Caldilineaceae bacterium]
MHPTVQFGIDHLLADKLADLQGLRVGLVTNDTATTARLPHPLTPTRLALQRAGVDLTLLFAPEHGLGASAADGAEIGDTVDQLTGVPVYGLYGSGFGPSQERLAELDLLLFDIADIGARFYTYIWTLSYVLEACAAAQLPLWVLDRPNPLGGDLSKAEGPMLDEAHISTFIGRWAIPIRHSLTAGELAKFWQAERSLAVDLTVITAPGWQRKMDWFATGLPFVPTSPSMPSAETVFLYLATCFFEGTNLSEGRGTATPFRVVGAPWLDGKRLTEAFNRLQLPGIVARPTQFIPTISKHAGATCHGIMLHLTDSQALRPVAAGLQVVRLVKQQHPGEFAWLTYPTAANASGHGHFDRLVGTTAVRMALDGQTSGVTEETIDAWTAVDMWPEMVAPYLLYV